MSTIGIDTEVFATHKDSPHIIPAAIALGKPHTSERGLWTVDDGTDGGDLELLGSYYADGAAIEIGTPPSEHATVLTHRLWTSLKQVQDHVRYFDTNAQLTLLPRGFVTQRDLDTLDESWGDDASLHILGCRRDENIWGYTFERPDPKSILYRTIGHHFHAAIDPALQDAHVAIEALISALDVGLGVSSIYDTSSAARLRRFMYGRAGTYRLPPHGIEYRTLPSSVVLHSRLLFEAQALLFQTIVNTVVRSLEGTSNIFLTDIFGTLEERRAIVEATIESDQPHIELAQQTQIEIAKRLGVVSLATAIIDITLTANAHGTLHTITV